MYVEKTTAEERRIIHSKVDGLMVQFDTCQRLLQDISENAFEFAGAGANASKCVIDPGLFYDRLWIISDLLSNTLLQYSLMMGEGESGAVHAHIEGVDNARKAIAEEDARRQEHRRELEARVRK